MTLPRPVLYVGAGVIVVAALICLWPARAVPPAEQVKRQVIQTVRAAEEKDVAAIMEQIAPGFRMREGLDREDLHRFLLGRVLTQQWIRVFLVQVDTTEANGGVDVDAKFIYGNSKAKTLPELAATSSLEAYDVRAHYQHDPEGWRAVSASIQPISAKELVSLSP